MKKRLTRRWREKRRRERKGKRKRNYLGSNIPNQNGAYNMWQLIGHGLSDTL